MLPQPRHTGHTVVHLSFTLDLLHRLNLRCRILRRNLTKTVTGFPLMEIEELNGLKKLYRAQDVEFINKALVKSPDRILA